MLCFNDTLLNLLTIAMYVYVVKIRNNGCNHLKQNLFLNEICCSYVYAF